MRQSLTNRVYVSAIVILSIVCYSLISQSCTSRAVSRQQVGLPDTPAGRCATEFFKAFNSGSQDAVRDFYLKHRDESYLEEHPMSGALRFFGMVYESTQSLTPYRLAYASDQELFILCSNAKNESVNLIRFKVDEQPPHYLRVLNITPIPARVAAASASIDDELIESTIRSLAQTLRDQYVYPEKGLKIANQIEQNLADGKYSGFTDGIVLALLVGENLRAIGEDGHLGMQYGKPPDDEEMAADNAKEAAEANYWFRKVEILTGNIGYIALDRCHHSKEAMDVAVKAMETVADCDALVLDLRRNVGGAPEMVGLMASYLFDEPTLLGLRYSRIHDDEYKEFWSMEEVPGRRFGPEIPVYVLISSNTYSAAEAFAICLQEVGRATIVGEASGGGAHTVIQAAINDHFWMNIPYGRAMGPVSRTDWEGVGVIPDIQVPAGQALDTACADAAKRLSE